MSSSEHETAHQPIREPTGKGNVSHWLARNRRIFSGNENLWCIGKKEKNEMNKEMNAVTIMTLSLSELGFFERKLYDGSLDY